MGVCASSELEPTQDTFSTEIDSLEPLDPKELHSRCRKLLELSNIIPVLIMPRVIRQWRRDTKLSAVLLRLSVRSMIQTWRGKIQSPAVRKRLNKLERIRNEVAILAEIRASRRKASP